MNNLMGINENKYDPKNHSIISNGSCTTYSLGIISHLLSESFGIKHGFVSNIHSYTSEQKILDGPYPKSSALKRCRSGAVNIIPTSSGACEGVAKVIPELIGKMSSIGYRVPVSSASIIDIIVETEKNTTKESINNLIKEKTEEYAGTNLLSFTEEPLVSSDITGNQYASLVDLNATNVIGGKLVRLNIWQDNEWGYTVQTIRLIKHIYKKGF